MSEARALNYEKVKSFLGQAVNDVGTATLGALSYIGDRLDLFKSMAAALSVHCPSSNQSTQNAALNVSCNRILLLLTNG